MTYNPAIHHRRSIRLKGYDYTRAGAYYITICTQVRLCLFGEVVNGEMRLNEAGRIIDDTWRWLQEQYDYVEIAEYVVMPNHLHGIIVLGDDRNEPDARVRNVCGVGDDQIDHEGRDNRDDRNARDDRDARRGGSRTAPTENPAAIHPIKTHITGAPDPTHSNIGSAAMGTGGSRTARTVIPAPTSAKRKPVGRLIGAFKTVSTKHINEIRQTPGMTLWQRDFYEHIIRDEDDYQRIHQYILDNPLEWENDKLYSKEQQEWQT